MAPYFQQDISDMKEEIKKEMREASTEKVET